MLDVLADSGGGDGEGVGGGWFGYLGYGLGAAIERLPPPPPRPVPLPVASLGFYDHVLRLDAGGAWWFEALDERALPRLDVLRGADVEPPAARVRTRSTGLEPAPGALAPPHRRRRRLRRADRGRRAVPGEPDAAPRGALRRQRRRRVPGRGRARSSRATARSSDLGGDRAVLELLARAVPAPRRRHVVTTSPIKGTAPREAGAEALLASRQGRGRARDDRRPLPQRPRPRGASTAASRRARSAPSRTPACGTSSPTSPRACARARRTPTSSARRSRPAP